MFSKKARVYRFALQPNFGPQRQESIKTLRNVFDRVTSPKDWGQLEGQFSWLKSYLSLDANEIEATGLVGL